MANAPQPDASASQHWQRLRERKIAEASGKCQLCSDGGKMHLHHRTYARQGRERDDDVIVLCSVCHSIFHSRGNGKNLRRPKKNIRPESPVAKVKVEEWVGPDNVSKFQVSKIANFGTREEADCFAETLRASEGSGSGDEEFRRLLEIRPLVWTADEAAAVLLVKRDTVLNLYRVGLLNAIKVGKHLRFRPRDVEAFVESRGTDAESPD